MTLTSAHTQKVRNLPTLNPNSAYLLQVLWTRHELTLKACNGDRKVTMRMSTTLTEHVLSHRHHLCQIYFLSRAEVDWCVRDTAAEQWPGSVPVGPPRCWAEGNILVYYCVLTLLEGELYNPPTSRFHHVLRGVAVPTGGRDFCRGCA